MSPQPTGLLSVILRLPLAGATRGEVRYANFIATHPSGGRASLAIFERPRTSCTEVPLIAGRLTSGEIEIVQLTLLDFVADLSTMLRKLVMR
jgi:hypothetical protein